MLFSENIALNRNIEILGIFGLFPLAPLSFYMGFPAVDVYYATNILFVLLVLAFVRHVKICQTLAYWKFCLTAGNAIVSLQIDTYDYIFFDLGVAIIFAVGACLCDNRLLRPINNETPPENE